MKLVFTLTYILGCIDCSGSISRTNGNSMEDSFDANKTPVYKLNSVIDWLDHRKYRIKEQ